ncbi:MAG: type II toxin-antitoxin system RelB/DinJ family antitoxin [Thermodesulfobacteriota bacterium]|nr:type II toxin-antitoxin system RelB/DinJ family antitoxin [Thermodesulfobacteriota bacterium]
MKTAVIRARIPENLKQDFEAAAEARHLSLSNAMRMLMSQYVEQEKELSRRREETLEAIEDIESGRIVDGDEVMAWLASWGSEAELDPPL